MRRIAFLKIVLLILFFSTCQTSEQIKPDPDSEAIINIGKSIRNTEALKILMGNIESRYSNSRINPIFYREDLDFDKMIEIYEHENNELPNFTIPLFSSEENVKEFLVLVSRSDQYYGYIMQFDLDSNTDFELENFTGEFKIIDLDGQLLSHEIYESGSKLNFDSKNNAGKNIAGIELPDCCDCEIDIEYKGRTKSGGANGLGTMYFEVVGIDCDCSDCNVGGGDGSGGGTSSGSTGGGGGSTGGSSGIGTPIGGGGSTSGSTSSGGGTISEGDDQDIVGFAGTDNKIDFKKQWEAQIDGITNPGEKRKEQLNYIATHNGQEGRDFKNDIEALLATPGLTIGEVSDINQVVNDYWEELIGRLMMAHFYPVAETAKPFIELALIETGSGVLFQAVKGLLSVKWGVQLAKIGVNTTSLTSLVNRIKTGLSFASNNSSLTLKFGSKNLFGSAVGSTTSSRVAYRFNGISNDEAKAVFQDMTSGRQIKRVELGGGKYYETVTLGSGSSKRSITFRNFSRTGQTGDPIIDIKIPEVRSGVIELKFFP